MTLNDELRSQGDWLFRWRGYLPMILIIFIAAAFTQFDWPFQSYRLHQIWEFTCLGVSFLGLIIRIATVGHTPMDTSGRNTKRQVADGVNTTGMYSIVRHPLYLGNFLIGLGIASVMLVWWLPLIYMLTFWLYYERIMLAEEAFLHDKFGDAFDDWAANTPTFWPAFGQWRRPSLKFSLRNVLGREYTGLFVIVLGHTGIEFVEHIVMFHRLGWERFWVVFSLGGTIIYVVLRELKRRTQLLRVQGR